MVFGVFSCGVILKALCFAGYFVEGNDFLLYFVKYFHSFEVKAFAAIFA